MRLIKLTEFKYTREIYINVSHLEAFWEEGGATYFITTYGGNALGRVKETPEEIIQLIKQVEEI